MKRKKIVTLALAAALLMGGTFVGTKALFKDTVKNAGQIILRTGDLDIEITGQGEWELKRNGEEANQNSVSDTKLTETKFDNLKCGDTITKTITVTNKGTLNAKVSLEDNHRANLPKGMTYTASFGEEGNTTLAPKGTAKVTLTIAIDNETYQHIKEGNDLNSDNLETQLINVDEAFTLNYKSTLR